jgi:ATP-dependent RNA helicase UAP56/SUB2
MGKTAVFVLSVLHLIGDAEETSYTGPSVLVIAHTRELAFQITKEFERFAKHFKNVRSMFVYGGMPISDDKKNLKEKKPVLSCRRTLNGSRTFLLALLDVFLP